MAKDLHDLARMMRDLPDELQKAQRRGVQKVALAVTTEIRGSIRTATGGDMRLSGSKRGARVGARFDVRGQENPTAVVRATGPLHLLEHDTKPHDIAPKKRRRDGKKVRALRLADGSFRAVVHHPGTRAKKPFEKGYKKAQPHTGLIFDREMQAGIGRALR